MTSPSGGAAQESSNPERTLPTKIKLDNTALTAHQTCPAKFDLRINQGWAARFRSGALTFGGAFHAGLAEWYRTGQRDLAFNAIVAAWEPTANDEDWRTLEKCLRTMDEYTRVYPAEAFVPVRDPEGNAMIEIPFSLDTGLVTSQGVPIEYGGIFDGLVDYGGQVFVLEHKTTSMLGQYYFDQFRPNNQVSGYVWAASMLSGRKVNGALINAIGVFRVGKSKYERQFTTRTEHEMDEWKMNLVSTASEIVHHQQTGYWPMRTSACTLYGRCEFHSVHSLATQTERANMLELEYEYNPWDYEKR